MVLNQSEHSTKRLLVIALLLSLPAIPGAAPPGHQARARRVIEITAERFEFWPAEITLEQGEDVELRIRSDDTVHGFRIVGTSTNLAVPKRGKGQAVTVFTPERPGRYTFECSRMCGAGHHFMRGVLIVRERPAEDDRQ